MSTSVGHTSVYYRASICPNTVQVCSEDQFLFGVDLLLQIGAPRRVLLGLPQPVQPLYHSSVPLNNRNGARSTIGCFAGVILLLLVFTLSVGAPALGPRGADAAETSEGHDVGAGGPQLLQVCRVQAAQVEEPLQVRPRSRAPVAHVRLGPGQRGALPGAGGRQTGECRGRRRRKNREGRGR